MTAMKAMKVMKSMKAMKAMTVMKTYSIAAEMVGLTPKQVKEIAEAMMALAAKQVQSVGAFKIAGAINITLKKKPATAARNGLHPITKEPCVFKAKKASQKWRIIATKKFLLMLLFADYLII